MTMETKAEMFDRLNRISKDHEQTLRMLYEDSGPEGVVAYFTAMCGALSTVIDVNNDCELAIVLANICRTTGYELVKLGIVIKLIRS
jgi:hypothetical protein